MGVVSKYGNLYDVSRRTSSATSSHFESILQKGNVLPMMNGVTTPELFGIHADKKFKRGRWRRVLTH